MRRISTIYICYCRGILAWDRGKLGNLEDWAIVNRSLVGGLFCCDFLFEWELHQLRRMLIMHELLFHKGLILYVNRIDLAYRKCT